MIRWRPPSNFSQRRKQTWERITKWTITLGNWELINPTGKFHPKTLTLHAHSDKDTTRVSFHAGDFGIVLTGNADIETMTDKFTKINEGLTQQLERDSMIDIPSFRPLLPDMDLKITAGKDNPTTTSCNNIILPSTT